jgi:5-hydroxyisourate hydrolase
VTLSTHVLDVSAGRPAAGVPVRVDRETEDGWNPLAAGRTGADGRLSGWAVILEPGVYRLVYDTAAYLGPTAFFPEVTVVFRVGKSTDYHVPLLLSPFGYSRYLGS